MQDRLGIKESETEPQGIVVGRRNTWKKLLDQEMKNIQEEEEDRRNRRIDKDSREERKPT